MALMTRSASLAEISGTHEGDDSTHSDGKLPELHSRIPEVYRTVTTSSNYGGSPQKLGQWNWLKSSKSFHEKGQTYNPPASGKSNGSKVLFATQTSTKSDDPYHRGGTAHSASPRLGSITPPRRRRQAVRPRYLDHLETLLPQFCHHLSHPTFQEASNAMSLLLNSTPPLPTSSSGETSMDFPPNSPSEQSIYSNRGRDHSHRNSTSKDSAKSSVTSEMNRLLSSPFRVRKQRRRQQQEEKAAERAFANRGWSNLSSSRSTMSADQSHHSNYSTKAHVHSTFTQKVDAASWCDFVAPLILLAGAEAIYADLEHVHPNPTIIPWPGLYQRVASELRARLPQQEAEPTSPKPPQSTETKTRSPTPMSPPQSPLGNPTTPQLLLPPAVMAKGLLDPATATPIQSNLQQQQHSPKPATPPKTQHYKRLLSLCTWLDVKLRWLPLHESLYLTWSLENLLLVREFAANLPDKEICMDCSARLLEALHQEVQATLALMEMGFSLERGRFLETICMARKVKKYLTAVAHKETALILWMKTTFQDYLSIMALVFDKIHTFASPLYGFDLQILMDATQGERTFMSDKKGVADLDSLVLDFLRRQEKAGGTAMAVTIVLDSEVLEDDDDPVATTSVTTVNPHSNGETNRGRHHHHHHHHHHRVEVGYAIHDVPKPHSGSALSSAPHHGSQPQQHPQQGTGAKPNIPNEGEEKSSSFAEPRLWPAVYLRSSLRLGTQVRGTSSNTGMGLISGMRRNASSRGSGVLDGPASNQHGSGLLLSQSRTSIEGMSPRSKYRKSSSSNRIALTHGNIFEYETEPSIRPSWPHSEWLQLRAFLEALNLGTGTLDVVTDYLPGSPTSSPNRSGDSHVASFEGPLAVTLQPDGMQSEATNTHNTSSPAPTGLLVSSSSIFSTQQLWDPLPAPPSASIANSSAAETGNTTFHAVQVNDFMWMVVMVKGEEESRWHRRKSRGLPDNEIRDWLNGMASKLRISNRFVGLKTCQTARVKVKDRLAPRVRGRDLGLREALWQSGNADDLQDEVLELMKEAFSVSGSTAMMNRAESILTTMSGGFRSSTVSRSPRDRRRLLAAEKRSGPFAQNSDYREGAALLFLGPELFRQFLESTNE